MKFAKILVLTAISVSAHSLEPKPYIGAEFGKSKLKVTYDDMKNVFANNPKVYNIFMGMPVSEHINIELGYEFQKRLKKTRISRNITNSDLRVTSPYAGVILSKEIPRLKDTSLGIMVGASISTINANVTRNVTTGRNRFGNIVVPTTDKFNKTRLIPMIKIAGEIPISNKLKIRCSFTWRNTSKFRFINNDTASSLSLNNSTSISAGIKYVFM